MVDEFQNSILIYENDGTAAFTRNVLDTDSRGPVWAEAADVDGDGENDIIFAALDDNFVGLHQNQGSGNYIRGTVNEDVALGLLRVQVADDDAGAATMEVTVNVVNGTIILNTSSVTVLSGGSSTSAITFEGNVTDINAALNSFTYSPTDDFNGLGEVQITVDDRGNTGPGGAKTATETLFVEVNAVNDDPTNVGTLPSDVPVTEDVSTTIDLSAIDLSDIDAGSGSMTLTLATTGAGNLSGLAGTGITISGNLSSTLTLEGTLTDLNNYLNDSSRIYYLHQSPDTNGDNADTITVVVNDNGNTGSGGGTNQNLGTLNVDIGAENDAPVNVVPVSQSVAADTSLTFQAADGNAISIFDVDAGVNSVEVTLNATNGLLTLGGTSGLSLTTRRWYIRRNADVLGHDHGYQQCDGRPDVRSDSPPSRGRPPYRSFPMTWATPARAETLLTVTSWRSRCSPRTQRWKTHHLNFPRPMETRTLSPMVLQVTVK